ncbi:MAG: hypothetical protein JW838_11550 [Spirochaetes bacterium]|nr:hypothetical protein [Spirochaetota bacterium]
MSFQTNHLATGLGRLATMEDLKTSRNIKIPFTIARNKMIANLVGILTKTYPAEIRSVVTFSFAVEPQSKKLSIAESREYTVMLNNDELNRIQNDRNRVSARNFLELIAQFRLFNLTKLLKKTSNRALLTQAIKGELNTGVFTYKHYSIDRQGIETAEDFCFHRDNYESVKDALNMERLNKVIAHHSNPILRRLKKFGILNAEFSDYRDTKLDYILSVLLQDIFPSLSGAEQTEVKNFNSLRSCLIKVETLIDPIVTAGADIAAYVMESRICPVSTIVSLFNGLTEQSIVEWAGENGPQHKIVLFRDEDGTHYLIDGSRLLTRMEELHALVVSGSDGLVGATQSEKERILDEIGLLFNAGRNLVNSGERAKAIIGNDESINRIHRMIEEYDNYQNSLALGAAVEREERSEKKSKTILESITDFFRSIFSSRKDEASTPSQRQQGQENDYYRPTATGEAKNILYKIKNSNLKIIPLSNYIDLLPANEDQIETIIQDVRKLNLKIVIPIYNSRKVLYPNRSQLYLIPDIEYLMVDTDLIQSPELIREFIDSLAGEKLKDEKMTPPALLNIEKYLMSLYTQKKAQMMKKVKSRK